MAKSKSAWTTVSMAATGGLDTRSRPADLPPGFFRSKVNMEMTPSGQLKRRGGFERFYADSSISPYPNFDRRDQGGPREPIVFLQETTDNSGTRRLFSGSESWLAWLGETTGSWNDILTGQGAVGSRWKMGILQNVAVIGNGTNAVYQHVLGSGSASTIPDLVALQVTAAKVVVSFNGFILLMNMTQGGVQRPTRIRWSDLNLPLSYAVGGGSLANFQDLDYGDEILAAAPLYGAMYVFTRRSIWRINVVADPNSPLTFTRVYNEPRSQKGCLVFPQTLTSDGSCFFYASREAIYKYSPFVAAPERGDEKGSTWGPWLYNASGVIFTQADTLLRGNDCASPCAEFKPESNELWFSWPAIGNTTNNYTLVAQTQIGTCDIVDTGFTALTNFRRTPTSDSCNEFQNLIGASNLDWALKSIGTVFYREVLNLPPDLTIEVEVDNSNYLILGYNSRLRGPIPLGLTDREKRLREVSIQVDIAEQDVPAVIRCRIANSFTISDSNDTDGICSPQWRDLSTIKLTCPESESVTVLAGKNLRPSRPMSWNAYERGRYLHFDLTIEGPGNTAAVGGDVSFSSINFDASSLPKS